MQVLQTEEKSDEFLACSSMKLTSNTGRQYWFRTFDLKSNIWENNAHLVSIPKGYGITFSGHKDKTISKYDMIGMTYNNRDEWVVDGINSKGLLGGILFLYEGNSVETAYPEYTGVSGLEVLAYILAKCGTIEEVCQIATDIQVTNIPIRGTTVASTLHYIFIDDKGKSVILEAADPEQPGIFKIYKDNQLGILTNSPVYPEQLKNLSWFISQSPELKYGIGGKAITSLKIDSTVITADLNASHVCQTGTFPASYTSYDRFVRMSILKALNHNGEDWSDEQILAYGMGIMRSVFEPHSQGIYHYVQIDSEGKLAGQGDGYSQYIIIYDLTEKMLYIQPYDTLAWTRLSLENCSKTELERHKICRDSMAGIITY